MYRILIFCYMKLFIDILLFRPNKPKFNEKDVMENVKNHDLIFGKTLSDECKDLIYHLLDPDINKRYNSWRYL